LLNKAEMYWIKFYNCENVLLNFEVFSHKKYSSARKIGQFRRILRINQFTGEVKEYSNMTEACLKNNIHIGNMSNCASGKRQTAGGFV